MVGPPASSLTYACPAPAGLATWTQNHGFLAGPLPGKLVAVGAEVAWVAGHTWWPQSGAGVASLLVERALWLCRCSAQGWVASLPAPLFLEGTVGAAGGGIVDAGCCSPWGSMKRASLQQGPGGLLPHTGAGGAPRLPEEENRASLTSWLQVPRPGGTGSLPRHPPSPSPRPERPGGRLSQACPRRCRLAWRRPSCALPRRPNARQS